MAEMDEDLGDFGGTEVADVVLIGCAQSIEHYEIARYGLLKLWAWHLGLTEAETLLDATLFEEKNANALLTQVAEAVHGAAARSDKGAGTAKAKAA